MKNELNTNGLNIDNVLGLFWAKTITRWVVAIDLMVDLDLYCIYGFDMYFEPYMDMI